MRGGGKGGKEDRRGTAPGLERKEEKEGRLGKTDRWSDEGRREEGKKESGRPRRHKLREKY